ncbi:transcriptional regulator [Pseudomonas jessenii]|uniref:DNA-binding transcriptional regulator, XRE-family HTH domain n=1 Tax=Pseudomonas jessenii TaxID=77298 RepID=A0A231GQ11_PSEJE|nr:helix-turn-helix domain-containing protein [Pseudomonas jessenii]OXR38662.1 transcriptional regulator [Pseudomonas jessenii]SEC49740.1 DNA-binding transcriptional regulator, XRE-family HTH domain [Pseudomonas jessenii]
MSVRIAFAAALKLLRTKRGLTQVELSKNLTQSHVSQIENEKTSPSLEAIIELARVLGLSPVALMALVCAAQDEVSAGDVLKIAEKDLQDIALLQASIPLEIEETPHPRVTAAAKMRSEVQALKEQGLSQAEIARKLGMAKTTVQRHWHRSD